MKLLPALFLFFLLSYNASAQTKDSVKLSRRSFDSTLFANDDTLTRSDYLLSFEKVYQTLNRGNTLSQPVPVILSMVKNINEDDSILAIIKDRLYSNDRALNVRNLQMFIILLEQIQKDTRRYAHALNDYDSVLDSTKRDIFNLRNDTAIRHIFKDSNLRATFQPQIKGLGQKWKRADSIIKYVNVLIDNTLALTSNNLITTNELRLQAEDLSEAVGSRAFTKERRYLLESRSSSKSQSISGQLRKTLVSEKEITQYYFSHTHFQFNLLLITGLIFFFWVFANFKSLRKLNKINTLDTFHFQYINTFSIFASLIFMLNLAPLFDLDAPVVYIDSIEFLLLITLTVSFRKHYKEKLFHMWILFLVFFLLSFSRYLGLPFYINRWLSFFVNCASLLLGIYALFFFSKNYGNKKIIIFVTALYTMFNLFAIICNLSGRVTLMQIFSSTATYAFIQTVSLLVFKQAVTEAFILQIQTSRIRKDYPDDFDYKEVIKGISRMTTFCAVVIWLVVFVTNLNLYHSLSGNITDFLTENRTIGSFTFTLGGVILFLAIIWLANFLQKYIAYFFGDIGDEAAFNNKSHRSRLLITRLVLLIGGFLLAVAASGLPVDRITVILGALGVGIGLGLQSIVNNFVSGIILIFDRTLRIGDTVEIGDKKGRVKDISVRSSTILTADGAEVIIPNGDILSHNIVNWTLSNNNIRLEISFTVDRLMMVEDIRPEIKEIIQASSEVLSQREPEILINNVTSQSTQLKIYFWCKDVAKTELARSEIYASIWKYLEGKGIKIT
jgi:potassium-dependent mechanosensitive channel